MMNEVAASVTYARPGVSERERGREEESRSLPFASLRFLPSFIQPDRPSMVLNGKYSIIPGVLAADQASAGSQSGWHPHLLATLFRLSFFFDLLRPPVYQESLGWEFIIRVADGPGRVKGSFQRGPASIEKRGRISEQGCPGTKWKASPCLRDDTRPYSSDYSSDFGCDLRRNE